MKVKELIKILKRFNKDLDVIVCDEIEGNDCELSGVEMGKTQIDAYRSQDKPEDVVVLRWSNKGE